MQYICQNIRVRTQTGTDAFWFAVIKFNVVVTKPLRTIFREMNEVQQQQGHNIMLAESMSNIVCDYLKMLKCRIRSVLIIKCNLVFPATGFFDLSCPAARRILVNILVRYVCLCVSEYCCSESELLSQCSEISDGFLMFEYYKCPIHSSLRESHLSTCTR